MAKKKTAAKKRPPPKKTAKARKGPKSQVLPGLEGVRNQRLDNICEGVAHERAVKNAALLEEKSLEDSALQLMTREGIQVYAHAGVELARIPGVEKLRVRLRKETGDADESGLEAGDDDGQDGQD